MSEQNEKVVELEKTIKPTLLEDNNKNVLDKPSSFSQKIMTLFFSNTKNEGEDEDEGKQEILKAIIRDDIENLVPVSEEMLRDEIVEPLVKELLVVEPLVKEFLVKESLVKELLVKESLVKELLVKESLVEELLVVEPLVKELLVVEPLVKELLVVEPLVKELLTSEIDVKLKRQKFFCCYM